MDPEAVRRAVAPVLVNASSYPAKIQPHILGQDMGPLIERVVTRVVNAVDATPAQGIDRTVLELWLREHLGGGQAIRAEGLADGILALVRPVEGVILSTEEATLALPYIERAIETYPWEDDGPLRALAARLEASS